MSFQISFLAREWEAPHRLREGGGRGGCRRPGCLPSQRSLGLQIASFYDCFVFSCEFTIADCKILRLVSHKAMNSHLHRNSLGVARDLFRFSFFIY